MPSTCFATVKKEKETDGIISDASTYSKMRCYSVSVHVLKFYALRFKPQLVKLKRKDFMRTEVTDKRLAFTLLCLFTTKYDILIYCSAANNVKQSQFPLTLEKKIILTGHERKTCFKI